MLKFSHGISSFGDVIDLNCSWLYRLLPYCNIMPIYWIIWTIEDFLKNKKVFFCVRYW